MFDKKIFSEVLRKIYNTFNNQRDFADAMGVNRGYLSQYMNMKIDNPPSPGILQKIADASRGITTYGELMQICGYLGELNQSAIYEFASDSDKKIINDAVLYAIQNRVDPPRAFENSEIVSMLDKLESIDKQQALNQIKEMLYIGQIIYGINLDVPTLADEMLKYFYKLNVKGQEKAIENVKDLTEIPKYTKQEK